MDVPDQFTLNIITEIYPEKNTALEGLYKSSVSGEGVENILSEIWRYIEKKHIHI